MFRNKRTYFSAVTAPTAVKVRNSKTLDTFAVESLLTEFISNVELRQKMVLLSSTHFSDPQDTKDETNPVSLATHSSSVLNRTILTQLKRVQRELRGLPPTLELPNTFNRNKNSKKNKQPTVTIIENETLSDINEKTSTIEIINIDNNAGDDQQESIEKKVKLNQEVSNSRKRLRSHDDGHNSGKKSISKEERKRNKREKRKVVKKKTIEKKTLKNKLEAEAVTRNEDVKVKVEPIKK
ncbi:uncharacterized protein ASCRUDRAFT_73540 [Ascoidea rubescens DSM 1968]|uniref:Uncharacterized protein n=1 Tax=Ascoidea rubescens DSM 1968 TaxID=1344418 RepID=A0A1D2VQ75_9ASCO|nr:hypothetical protein ASCRUDRAFT_73540 [Ascoidea rubescens DSM 1968]ODV63749.1 hypothetical protein ASCRUDRAFT_73540 [Ascoidea rubescens DSM 1968]